MGYVTRQTYRKCYAPSDDEIINNAATVTFVNNSYQLCKTITLASTIVGTSKFRFKFELWRNGGAGNAFGRIYRNGVAVGTEQTTASAVAVEFVEDINTTSWVVGDTIELWAHKDVLAAGTNVANFKICGVGSEFFNTLGA